MRLLYDARHVVNPYTGLARYSASLLDALLRTRERNDFEVEVLCAREADLRGNPHYESLQEHVARARCRIHFEPTPAITLAQHWHVSRTVRRLAPDAYFYPHFDPPLGVTVPTTFVVHDLIPLKVAGYVQRFEGLKKVYFASMIRLAMRKARCCVAVSQTTRRDLIDLLGQGSSSRITVAYEGPVLDESDGQDTGPALPKIDGRYLLYVGDRRPHKNLPRLLDLFDALRRRAGFTGSLVLAGSTTNFDVDIDRRITGRDDVIVLGNVTDAALARLYRAADALVMLSAYEGFGLPVVEAARFGTRMILSDGGALAEIAPAGACRVPLTMNVEEAALRVDAYLSDSGKVDLSLPAAFSWEAAARSIFPEAYLGSA